MTNRLNNAIDKLVTAFFNETLSKGDCDKCAVGNIVGSPYWSDVFLSSNGEQFFKNLDEPVKKIVQKGIDDIKATGYSVDEMARIEFAFEQNTSYQKVDVEKKGLTRDEFIQDQFSGLCAVLDVLCELDNIENSQCYKDVLREKPEVV